MVLLILEGRAALTRRHGAFWNLYGRQHWVQQLLFALKEEARHEIKKEVCCAHLAAKMDRLRVSELLLNRKRLGESKNTKLDETTADE